MAEMTAAWVPKNERGHLGHHAEAVGVLRQLGYVRIIHGAAEGGQWPILAIEAATPPTAPVTMHRRSTPETQRGYFWCSRRFEAFLHTADRRGLHTYALETESDAFVAEFVATSIRGRRSGGEFILELP